MPVPFSVAAHQRQCFRDALLIYDALEAYGVADSIADLTKKVCLSGIVVDDSDIRAGMGFMRAHPGQLPDRPKLLTYHGGAYRLIWRQDPDQWKAVVHTTIVGAEKMTRRSAALIDRSGQQLGALAAESPTAREMREYRRMQRNLQRSFEDVTDSIEDMAEKRREA
jgi:hypothetical protein